jgi:hypothetical protein
MERAPKEFRTAMSSTKHKLRLAGAFAALLTLGLAISCKGFFQNPTITSITINPSNPSVSQASTEQLNASGTDSTGNSYTLTGGTTCSGTSVCWSSSDTTIATITSGGLLKGITVGSATITANSGTASATAGATVTLGDVTALTIKPGSVTLTENSTASGNECFTATATLSNGPQQDVTSTVTWVSSSTNVTPQNQQEPMCVMAGSTQSNSTIFAQYTSGNNVITSNTANVTVNP